MIKSVSAYSKYEHMLPKTVKILQDCGDANALKEIETLFLAFQRLAIKRYPIKAKSVDEMVKQTLKLEAKGLNNE